MAMLLVFDLDGTLVDSREDLSAAVNLMRADLGMAPLSVPEICGLIGDGVQRLVARALAGSDVDLHYAVGLMKKYYNERLHDRTRPYPGVEQGLRQLCAAGHSCALVSNKIVSACEEILRHFDLFSMFAVVLGADSLPNLKPHPQPILEAMRRTNFDAGRVWMIGDHVTDMEAGKAAGAHCAFVTYGIGAKGNGPIDRCFDSFDELTHFFLNHSAT